MLRIAISIIVAYAILLILVTYCVNGYEGMVVDLLVEAHGVVFDGIVFSILAVWLSSRFEARQKRESALGLLAKPKLNRVFFKAPKVDILQAIESLSENKTLSNLQLIQQDLGDCDFSDYRFGYCTFFLPNGLNSTVFEQCVFTNCHFIGLCWEASTPPNFKNSKFINCNLTELQFPEDNYAPMMEVNYFTSCITGNGLNAALAAADKIK